MVLFQGRYATDEELLAAHSQNHLNQVKGFNDMTPKELMTLKEAFHSVYFHQESYQAASLAAGCLLQASFYFPDTKGTNSMKEPFLAKYGVNCFFYKVCSH